RGTLRTESRGNRAKGMAASDVAAAEVGDASRPERAILTPANDNGSGRGCPQRRRAVCRLWGQAVSFATNQIHMRSNAIQLSSLVSTLGSRPCGPRLI